MKSAILFAVAFAATAWGAYVPEPRPKDKASQWWHDRHDVNRRWIAGCDGAYDLVFIGDSITHNWENSGHGILEGLRLRYSILNLGYCSDRIPHILWRLENGELDGYRAKGVMVMAGTNNYRDDPTNVVAGVRQILETVRARQPQAKILLCALLPSGTSDADERRQKNRLVNPLLKKLADEMKVEWIDFGDRFLGPDGAVVNMLKDNLHPDWKGYRDWAEAVQPVFTRWIGGDLFAQKDRQYLWPEGKMPDVQPHQGATLAKTCNEVFDPKKGGNTRPYLDWALPPDPAKANGACMILVSGGGYHNCCDGEYVYARWPRLFRDLGFQCVTLIYRTPRAKGIPYYQTAWEDGQRAVRLVREAAAKRGYDPERIGTISVSAGAHLTSLLATSSQTPAYARIDATDDVSAHLNWAINFSTAYVRQGNGLDPILRFDGKTCPMCLCQGEEDPVSPECSIRMHAALRQRGILSELHLRPHAGHGVYGTDAAVAFLRRLGIVGGKPRLKFGVVSDLHLTTKASAEIVRRAFAYMKGCGVAAVLVPGDLTDYGTKTSLRYFRETWDEVFGGTEVAKVFCTGNHDYDGWGYGDMAADMRAVGQTAADHMNNPGNPDLGPVWQEILGTPSFAPIHVETVGGYDFVTVEYHLTNGTVKAWMEENGTRFRGEKPFFVLQHNPVRHTTRDGPYGGEELYEVLKDYPNAIVFAGHSHVSFNDEKSLWQDRFTSVAVPSLSYLCLPPSYMTHPRAPYENGEGSRNGKCELAMPMIPYRRDLRGGQGYVVSVYDTEMVIERIDFEAGFAGAPEWRVPLLGGKDVRPLTDGVRKACSVAPQFPPDAAFTATTCNTENRSGKWIIAADCRFPSALPGPGERVFEYEIRIVFDDGTAPIYKRFLSPAYGLLPEAEPDSQRFWFDLAPVPCGKTFHLEARALNAFGKASEPIRTADWRISES